MFHPLIDSNIWLALYLFNDNPSPVLVLNILLIAMLLNTSSDSSELKKTLRISVLQIAPDCCFSRMGYMKKCFSLEQLVKPVISH